MVRAELVGLCFPFPTRVYTGFLYHATQSLEGKKLLLNPNSEKYFIVKAIDKALNFLLGVSNIELKTFQRFFFFIIKNEYNLSWYLNSL